MLTTGPSTNHGRRPPRPDLFGPLGIPAGVGFPLTSGPPSTALADPVHSYSNSTTVVSSRRRGPTGYGPSLPVTGPAPPWDGTGVQSITYACALPGPSASPFFAPETRPPGHRNRALYIAPSTVNRRGTRAGRHLRRSFVGTTGLDLLLDASTSYTPSGGGRGRRPPLPWHPGYV